MLKGSVKLMAALVTVATLIACANPGIVEISPDIYLLTRTDRGGMFGNPAAMKANVIREVNEFAESRGKVTLPVSVEETPIGIGRWAKIDYQFRLVDKDDPAVAPTSLIGHANENISTDKRAKSEAEISRVIYDELLMLEDLRQRGILTQAEFDAEKKKLLEGNKP